MRTGRKVSIHRIELRLAAEAITSATTWSAIRDEALKNAILRAQ